jgi:hypothetical protein
VNLEEEEEEQVYIWDIVGKARRTEDLAVGGWIILKWNLEL